MSAYYLKQVVKDWSLATIYKGMFQFMMLQVLAIALLIIFPPIATWFPEYLQEVARRTPVEQVADDAPSLEQDTMEIMQEQSEQDSKDAEKRDEQAPAQPK
jgi:hypothetical protein